VTTALFPVAAIGALGILGEGGRPDRVYAGVLAVAVLGTVVARFRARGMANALLCAAVAQALVTVVALAGGCRPRTLRSPTSWASTPGTSPC